MYLARVIGRVVATHRYAGLDGVPLQWIQPLDEHGPRFVRGFGARVRDREHRDAQRLELARLGRHGRSAGIEIEVTVRSCDMRKASSRPS